MNSEFRINGLLQLSLGNISAAQPLLLALDKSSKEERAKLVSLAESHHVVLRAFEPLSIEAKAQGHEELSSWCDEVLELERKRIANALQFLEEICSKLEAAGIHITVMKSLDHWPDIGNDLDLYTPSDQHEVTEAMMRNFKAWLKGRTWGDRLARKCNFGIEGLRESVEIHHGCLGQTGEHIMLAKRFYARRVPIEVGNHRFMIPAPEERVIAATLQRMYRHLYIRVCDIVNTHQILESGELDFGELHNAANLGGIWPGVATYLRIVTDFVRRSRGVAVKLPAEVLSSARFGSEEVFVRGIWLRVPAVRAAQFYGRQMSSMVTQRDMHGVFRLSLLPPLASAARLTYMVTGNHSGIW